MENLDAGQEFRELPDTYIIFITESGFYGEGQAVYRIQRMNLTGYYTQCFNRWDHSCHIQKSDGIRCKDYEIQAYKPLNLALIKEHMEGKDPYGSDVVAIYPMLEIISASF